jgi:hypothetical protein
MRKLAIALTAAMAMAATPIVVDAAPCKDAKGRFIKCPAAKPAPKKPCKDAKGKFIKCSR